MGHNKLTGWLAAALLLILPLTCAATIELSPRLHQPFLMAFAGGAYLVADWDSGLLVSHPPGEDPRPIPSPLARFWQPFFLSASRRGLISYDRRRRELIHFYPDGNLIESTSLTCPGEKLPLDATSTESATLVLCPDRVLRRGQGEDAFQAAWTLPGESSAARLLTGGDSPLVVQLDRHRLILLKGEGRSEELSLPEVLDELRLLDAALSKRGVVLLATRPGPRPRAYLLLIAPRQGEAVLISPLFALPVEDPRRIALASPEVVGVLDLGQGKIVEFRLPDEAGQPEAESGPPHPGRMGTGPT